MVVRGGSTDAIVLVVVLVLLALELVGGAVVLVMKMTYLPICLPSKT